MHGKISFEVFMGRRSDGNFCISISVNSRRHVGDVLLTGGRFEMGGWGLGGGGVEAAGLNKPSVQCSTKSLLGRNNGESE